MKWVFFLLLLFLLSSCQKEIIGGPEAQLRAVQFWTSYKDIEGVTIFINGKQFSHLEYYDVEPVCGEYIVDLLLAIPNRPFRVSYYGNPNVPTQLIDTTISITERDFCTIINLNN